MDTRSMLLQMCAARFGAQGSNPTATKLLEQLGVGGGGGGAPVDMRGLLDQMAADNPMARMLADHLAQQEASRRDAPPSVIDVAPDATSEEEAAPGLRAVEAPMSDEAAQAVLELKAKAEAMFAELQVLRERNEELAWALGACPLCWGADAECRSCRGQGRPGFRFPDPGGFLTYVVPAARMWKLKKLHEEAPRAPKAKSGESKLEVPVRDVQSR